MSWQSRGWFEQWPGGAIEGAARPQKAPGQYDILIDHRQATTHLSLTDVMELIQVMIEHRESFRSKLAILTRPDATLELAKFMELYAGNRGFRVGTFRDFEEAMNWLVTSTELPSEGDIS